MITAGCDAQLGELAFRDDYLATTADAATATDGIDVDAELTGSLQNRCADWKAAASAGGHEDEQGVIMAIAVAIRLRGISGCCVGHDPYSLGY
jgi:hypothetical protein